MYIIQQGRSEFIYSILCIYLYSFSMCIMFVLYMFYCWTVGSFSAKKMNPFKDNFNVARRNPIIIMFMLKYLFN